jgi:arylsulfatase A-like enzyme
MKTLYKNILDFLKDEGKSENDILWVGTENGELAMPWSDFVPMAKDITIYDSSHGDREIPENLVIVGNDWFLELHRDEYMEWWEFKTMPKMKSFNPFLLKKKNSYGGNEYGIVAVE